jgi:hypothetical protein
VEFNHPCNHIFLPEIDTDLQYRKRLTDRGLGNAVNSKLEIRPHIRKDRFYRYRCECVWPSGTFIAYGNTPEEAYQSWYNAFYLSLPNLQGDWS